MKERVKVYPSKGLMTVAKDLHDQLRDCTCCPRECHVNRIEGEIGFCKTGAGFSIASICRHCGEEPVISGTHGICNIFFTGCNMSCSFCQNHQISRGVGITGSRELALSKILDHIQEAVQQGSHAVGFVSPSHVVPQMLAIVDAIAKRGIKPVLVYNTNSYDKVATIRQLDGVIDVWLPDLKYLDEELARRFSATSDYPEIACAAVKEMFHQKGSSIRLDDDGRITAGLIIRHLVLPGEIENSRKVLRWIAEELSPSVHVSLMSQYHPTVSASGRSQPGRTLVVAEYDRVLREFERLGFYRGWRQELDSSSYYQPDFEREHPFE